MSELTLRAAEPGPRGVSGLLVPALAAVISLGVLYVISAPSPTRLALPAAGVMLIVILGTTRLTLRHKSWLIGLLVLEEVLPYINLIPADPANPEARWMYRYPLLLILSLPMLPAVWRSGILLQGRFKHFALYYAWCGATILYSLVPATSAGRLLPAILLFCALSAVALEVKSAEDVQRLVGVFVWGCGVLLAMVSIGALVLPHDLNWTQDEAIERFSGILAGPNELGGIMVAAVGAGLIHWKSGGTAGKAVSAFVIVSSLVLAAMADSRSAFVAVAVGAVLYVVWRYRARGVMACLALALLARFAWISMPPRWQPYFSRDIRTLTGRTEAWAFEVSKIKQRPLLGYGYEVEGQIFKDRYFPNWELFWARGADTPLHNGYLSIAVGVGVPALLFWALVYLSPWVALFGRHEDPWKLKPIALLVVAPILIMGLDESWVDAVRYPRGILMMLCWMLAERERLQALAAAALKPAQASRFSALLAVTGCLALAAGVVLRPPRLLAAGYYVDSGAGSDRSSGTSQNAPWQTIAKVNSVRFRPGDAVHFKRGGYWREMLEPKGRGAPGQPLVFTAYGAGPQPTISGADVISGWRSQDGAISSAALSGGASKVYNVYVDGGPGWGLARARGPVSMPPGSWWFDRQSATLYVRLADGSSPQGHTIEAVTRIAGFSANVGDDQAGYIVVRGLKVQRTGGYGIYFHSYAGVRGLRGIVIEDNTVLQTGTGEDDQGQYYNAVMLLQEPELDTAPRIVGNRISFSGGHGNAVNCQGADHAYIANNDVSHWNHNGIDVKNSRAVVVESNTAHDQPASGAGFYCEYLTDGVWRDNTAYNVSNGFQVGPGSRCELSDNRIQDAGTGIYLGPRAIGMTLRGNQFNRAGVGVSSDGSGTITGSGNQWGANPTFRIGPVTYDLSQWLARGFQQDTGE